MQKCNPVEYMRTKWLDPSHTKQHPCDKQHNFCNMPYEWLHTAIDPQPISASLPGVELPPPKNVCPLISYETMTEQDIDDWISQSMNRTLGSIINPQKKFFVPASFEEEVKTRYKNKALKIEDGTYFAAQSTKNKTMSYMSNQKKNTLNTNELLYDHRLLNPSTAHRGTPIKLRENRLKPKSQIRRRNAILLDKDIHYNRFLKELSKSKIKQSNLQSSHVNYSQKQMLFSYNLDCLQRKSCHQQVPNSIIEREFKRVREKQKQFINIQQSHSLREEQIQQKHREVLREKAVAAIARIENGPKQQPQAIPYQQIVNLVQKNKSKPNTPLVKLDEKVLRLLNSMQVVSQNIDLEMGKLNIHLEQVMLKNKIEKLQVKWVLKAQEKINERQNSLAIDCYKQAILIQPQYFIAVFNIAVLLEKEQMLVYAEQWFQLAKQFETDDESVSFGLALVQIKQLKFVEGLKEIDDLINRMDSRKKEPSVTYYYLRALCNKQLAKYPKARQDYQIIQKHSKPLNYSHLSSLLLSVVYARSRRLRLEFNSLSYMRWQESLFLLFYEKPKKIKDQSLTNEEFAQKLLTCTFFKRFPKGLIVKLLSEVTYEQIKKNSILFVHQDSTMMVLNGLVTVRCHEEDIKKPQTVSVLQQGSVIGGGVLDHNFSSQPNNWFLAATDLQVITINRKQFQLFWQGQITFQFDYKYNFLKNITLFKNLPQSTLFSLCQLVQRRTYDKNTILFNDCSYRTKLISREGVGFGLSKLGKSDYRFVNAKKNKLEEAVGSMKKKHVSRWCQILKKQVFKFNEMKFNRLKYPGLFILTQGSVEVEDDKGFRCTDILGERDYFGENLLIPSDGFQNYGRVVVASQQATFYLLPAEQMVWRFTLTDKRLMEHNAKSRKGIQTIMFLRNRYYECLDVKFTNRAMQNN